MLKLVLDNNGEEIERERIVAHRNIPWELLFIGKATDILEISKSLVSW